MIAVKAAEAFWNGREFKKDNTQVVTENGVTTMKLHGHPIARLWVGQLSVTTAGYPTATTKDRINAILRFKGYPLIWQQKGVWMWASGTGGVVEVPSGYDTWFIVDEGSAVQQMARCAIEVTNEV